MQNPVPEFNNEDEERQFWVEHDSTDYLDWSQAKHVIFPNLKPSTRTISIRLPESMLSELKQLANEQDVPYQSLIKMILRERIDREYRSRPPGWAKNYDLLLKLRVLQRSSASDTCGTLNNAEERGEKPWKAVRLFVFPVETFNHDKRHVTLEAKFAIMIQDRLWTHRQPARLQQ